MTENKNKRRNFFAPDLLWVQLMAVALKKDTTASELIRDALHQYLKVQHAKP